MAYQGYLLKIGSYTVPHSWIKAGSYSCTLHGQDLDSYRDANGELQRTALKHTVIGVQFETPPLKTMSEFEKEAIHRAGRREQLWELVRNPGMSGKVPRALINGTGISTVNDLSMSDLISDIWGGYPTIVNGKELIWVLPQWDDMSAKHDRGNRDDITISA